MGATTTARLTVQQFHELPLPDEEDYELVRGEIVRMAKAKFKHETVKSNFLEELVGYNLNMRVGKVYSETMYDLTDEDAVIPDVSVMLGSRPAGVDLEGYPQGAPDTVVEVVSSEQAAKLEERISLYLRTGAKW